MYPVRLSFKSEGETSFFPLPFSRWPQHPASPTSFSSTSERFREEDSRNLSGESHVADRVSVLWQGVRTVPLRWESRVQDIGPQQTSQLHVISNSESSLRDLHLSANTQLHSMMSNLQCWAPYAKQLARQEQNPSH